MNIEKIAKAIEADAGKTLPDLPQALAEAQAGIGRATTPEQMLKRQAFINAKIKYTHEPLGKVQVVPDFLPSPAELAFREEGVKVTLALSKKSIEFFKSEASKHHTQYQRMIRRLLDAYVDGQAR